MTIADIFNIYIKKKALVFLGLSIVVTALRVFFSKSETSILLIFAFSGFAIVMACIIGLLEYYFYENEVPKKTLKLLDKTPLKEFTFYGFQKEDNNRLTGQINGFTISLSPMLSILGDTHLTIHIPVTILNENHPLTFNKPFKLVISNDIIFVEAILSNYINSFDFQQLNTLLIEATETIKKNNISPLKVHIE